MLLRFISVLELTWHKRTYLKNRNKLVENRLEATKGEVGKGKGWTGSLGLVEANLLHLEWVNHKFLMYRTGNYIQYPVINHNGKKDKKRKECEHTCMHICV